MAYIYNKTFIMRVYCHFNVNMNYHLNFNLMLIAYMLNKT